MICFIVNKYVGSLGGSKCSIGSVDYRFYRPFRLLSVIKRHTQRDTSETIIGFRARFQLKDHGIDMVEVFIIPIFQNNNFNI